MKQKLLTIILLATFTFSSNVNAQVRYLEEVFSTTNVTADVVYGYNVTVISGSPALDTLKMDIYQPDGDTATTRPLIIYIHTGSFLPNPLNGQCTGDKSDSASVEMCKRFAKKGYVVASINYRLGWNPVGDQDTRTGTLLNAVYRAMQDAKSSIRFFRKSVAMSGNPYGIDDTKIALCGQGSGGYVALATATVDDYADITLPKFVNLTTGNPYVDTTLSGDWDGTGGMGLNQPMLNNPGYSSSVNFVINMGGAIGDSSWLQAGAAPMVCFHVPNDPFAPYSYGPVIVPTTQQFVVNVSGSYDIVRRANYLGNNASFNGVVYTDPYSVQANTVNDGIEGLCPLPMIDPPGPLPGQAGPWEWWDTTCVNNASSLLSNPDMSVTQGMAYIDTIQGYACPRMYRAFGLSVGVTQLEQLDRSVNVYPNPASDRFKVSIDNSTEPISSIRLVDISGREIINVKTDERRIYEFETAGLSAGLYFVKLSFEKGEVIKKINIR